MENCIAMANEDILCKFQKNQNAANNEVIQLKSQVIIGLSAERLLLPGFLLNRSLLTKIALLHPSLI